MFSLSNDMLGTNGYAMDSFNDTVDTKENFIAITEDNYVIPADFKIEEEYHVLNPLNMENIKISNDMRDACKTTCLICGTVLFVNALRGHTRAKHDINITAYKQSFGITKLELVKEVYHKCAICGQLLLLDSDTIAAHIPRHKITHKNYNANFMITNNDHSLAQLAESELEYEMMQEIEGENFWIF